MRRAAWRRWIEAALPVGVAGAAALLLALAVAWLGGTDPARVAVALVEGSVGSAASWTQTLLRTTPLLLAGLAVALAFRSGVFNIGAEGQLLVGALAATAVGTQVRPFPGQAVAVLGAGALAGALWALVAAALRIGRNVGEVISTILLNFLALYLVSWAVEGPLQEAASSYPQSDRLFDAALLWRLPGSRLHAGVALALAAAGGVGFLLGRTSLGLRLRASGLSPAAARLAGFPVRRELAIAFALSGALAGLAGAVEIAGVTGRLYERIATGTGYTAIAIALLGGLRASGVTLAALFFAALETGASAMERSAGVSSVIVLAVQGAALVALAVLGGGPARRWLRPRRAPAATAGGEEAGGAA